MPHSGKIVARLKSYLELRKGGDAIWQDRTRPIVSRAAKELRLFMHHVLNRPRYLSQEIDSVRVIRYRRLKRNFGNTKIGIARSLDGLAANTVLFASLLVVFVVVPCAIGAGMPPSGVQNAQESRASDIAQSLLTVAEIVGGVAGLLLAVIVFGVELYGDRLGRVSFLMRYYLKHKGVIPLATLSIALVCGNLIVSLVAQLRYPNSAIVLAGIDVFMIPLLLWMVLRVLHAIVSDASAEPLNRMMDSLTSEYEFALDEEEHHRNRLGRYVSEVETAGLEYNFTASFESRYQKHALAIKTNRTGIVRDVNLHALNALGELARTKLKDYHVKLGIAPGDPPGQAIALALERREQVEDSECELCPMRPELERFVKKLFIWGPDRDRDIVTVLAEFGEALSDQVKHDTSTQLERAFKVQFAIVKQSLARSLPESKVGAIYRTDLPDVISYDYWKLVWSAVDLGDYDKIQACVLFALRMLNISIEYHSDKLFRNAAKVVEEYYLRAIRVPELESQCSYDIDNLLLYGPEHLFKYQRPEDESPESLEQEKSVVIARVVWHVNLTKFAVEAGRIDDAAHFHDRLMMWSRHTSGLHPRPHEDPVPEPLREIYDIHLAAEIVIAAWCFHHARDEKKRAAARRVFSACKQRVGNMHDILRVWEVCSTRGWRGNDITSLFGATMWEVRGPTRSGTTSFHTGEPAEWAITGMVALMCAAPAAKKYEVPSYFENAPTGYPIGSEQVKRIATALLDDDEGRDILGVTKERCNAVIDAINELVDQRARQHQLQVVRPIIEAVISESRVNDLEVLVKEKIHSKRRLARFLDAQCSEAPIGFEGAPIEFQDGFPLWKREFVGEESPLDNDAELVAKKMEALEPYFLALATQKKAPLFRSTGSLQKLKRNVRKMIVELRDKGVVPDMMFVPNSHHLLRALFGGENWHLPAQGELGACHVGKYEGMHVFALESDEVDAITVVESQKFYRRVVASGVDEIRVTVEDRYKEDNDKLLESAMKAEKASEICNTSDIKVLVVGLLRLQVVIHEAEAGARIGLKRTKLGFAMKPGDKIYHTPQCKILNGAEEVRHCFVNYLLGERIGRSGCDVCDPWNWGIAVDDE